MQFEQEHRIRLERLKVEERRQQEQLEMEKGRRQEEMELEEREVRLQLKIAEDAKDRAARKVRLCHAAEDDLNWERRNDFDEPAAVKHGKIRNEW